MACKVETLEECRHDSIIHTILRHWCGRKEMKTYEWTDIRKALLPEVWGIVCLFLFNHQSTYVLSVPLRNLVCDKGSSIQFCLHNRVTHFLGADDGQSFRMAFGNGSFLTLSGHFAFPTTKHYSLVFPFHIDFDRRYLVRYHTHNEDVKEYESTCEFFVWTSRVAKWIATRQEADQFKEKTNNSIPIIQFRYGGATWYNRGDLLDY